MSETRDPGIAALLVAHRTVVAGTPDSPVKAFIMRCHEALETPGTVNPDPGPGQYPVCRHLEAALTATAVASPALADLANCFRRLAPRLGWRQRRSVAADDERFQNGHANAAIIGVDALEQHPDVRLGVSLLAPNVDYPDHRHPPEEAYLVMSGGNWRQNRGPWFGRGPGGLVHNPPDIWHAMQSGPTPLLALWMLWTRDVAYQVPG